MVVIVWAEGHSHGAQITVLDGNGCIKGDWPGAGIGAGDDGLAGLQALPAAA